MRFTGPRRRAAAITKTAPISSQASAMYDMTLFFISVPFCLRFFAHYYITIVYLQQLLFRPLTFL
jgi:hypothetical protein